MQDVRFVDNLFYRITKPILFLVAYAKKSRMQAFTFLNIGLKVVSACCNSLSVDHNVRWPTKYFRQQRRLFHVMYYSFTLIYDIH